MSSRKNLSASADQNWLASGERARALVSFRPFRDDAIEWIVHFSKLAEENIEEVRRALHPYRWKFSHTAGVSDELLYDLQQDDRVLQGSVAYQADRMPFFLGWKVEH